MTDHQVVLFVDSLIDGAKTAAGAFAGAAVSIGVTTGDISGEVAVCLLLAGLAAVVGLSFLEEYLPSDSSNSDDDLADAVESSDLDLSLDDEQDTEDLRAFVDAVERGEIDADPGVDATVRIVRTLLDDDEGAE